MAGESLTPKVLIATPCTDMVYASYALDLAALYKHSVEHGLDCGYVQNRGTIIPQQRHTLVAGAIEGGFTHILFVDSDMRFPRDALLTLLAHDKPIVAANYVRRRHPVLPTAEHFLDSGNRVFLFTDERSEGLAEVTFCGFGLVLIRMDVFATIPEPWFQIGYTKETGQYVGEDFFFCAAARRAGYDILIDQELSKVVKHTGSMEFTHAHAEQTRQHYKPKVELVTNGAR